MRASLTRTASLLALLTLALIYRYSPGLFAVELDLSNLKVPRRDVRGGGPPKDGIPSLTDPEVVPAAEAHFMEPSDKVLGVVIEGQARAYPLKILTHHEAANDVLGGRPIAATY